MGTRLPTLIDNSFGFTEYSYLTQKLPSAYRGWGDRPSPMPCISSLACHLNEPQPYSDEDVQRRDKRRVDSTVERRQTLLVAEPLDHAQEQP